MSIDTVSSVKIQGQNSSKLESVKKEDAQGTIFTTEAESEKDLNDKLFQEPEGLLDQLNSGLKSIDKYTFDIIKWPVKKLSEKIDEKFAGSKFWEITKGIGDVADFMLSTEGLLVMGATMLALKGVTKGAKKIGGTKGEFIAHHFIKNMFISYGGLEVFKGAVGAALSDTPEKARQAGENIGTGALFITGGYKMKSNLSKSGKVEDIKIPDARLAIKTNTPFREVKTKVTTLFDSLYEDLGIPKEARPKLTIIDNIKFKTKAEIEEMVLEKINERKYFFEEKLDKIEIFEESDNPMEMSVEEIKAKIQNAVKNTTDAKIYDFEYDNMLGNTKGTTGGGYSGGIKHELTVNLNTLRNGTFKSLEEVLVHEVEHSRNSILRHRLSKADASKIIKDALIDRIMNGEPEKIIVRGGILGVEMMEPPKMSAKMRADFAKFAEEKLYTDEAKNYIDDLSLEMQAWIENAIKENPDFVEQYGGLKGNATQMLTKYVQSHLVRYDSFSNTTLPSLKDVKFPELTEAEHAEATQSLIGHIETIEGNAGNQGLNNLFGSKSKFNQYQFSYEEVLARNTAAKYELTKLQLEPQTPEIEARIKDLEFQLKYNEIGSRFYRLYTEALNHPEDVKLKADLAELQNEFNKLDSQKAGKQLDYIIDMQIPYMSGMGGDAIWYNCFK